MATLVARGVLRLGGQQSWALIGTVATNKRDASSLAKYRRGTGGRSSFSGIVATVFGADGFIGRGVVNRLGKMGSQVIVPHVGDEYAVKDLKLAGDLGQILFTQYDPLDEESIYRCMKYSNVVINLIGQKLPARTHSLHDAHVVTPRLIASAAREIGIRSMIHFSAMGASPDPVTPWTVKEVQEHRMRGIQLGKSDFLKTKYEGEQAVLGEFPDAIIIRPAPVFGPGDNYLNYYTSMTRIGKSTGKYVLRMWKAGLETIKRPVFTGDLLDAFTVLLRDKTAVGKTYEFYGPNAYVLHDLVQYFHECLRNPMEIQDGLFWSNLPGMTEGGYKDNKVKVTDDISNTEYISDVPTGLPGFEECGIDRKKMMDITVMAPVVLRENVLLTKPELALTYFVLPQAPQPVVTI